MIGVRPCVTLVAISIMITSIKVEDLFNTPDFTCLSSIASEIETFYYLF